MECVHNVRCTAHLFFFCFFYVSSSYKGMCFGQTFSTGITNKTELTKVEIQEQTASWHFLRKFPKCLR